MKLITLLAVLGLTFSAYAAPVAKAKRGPASASDMCFETAERVAMFTFEQTDGGYGFAPYPSAITSSTVSNPDGTYTFGFGPATGGKDASQPTYVLAFHLDSRSQACSLRSFTIKN